jgi:hypothetical protein
MVLVYDFEIDIYFSSLEQSQRKKTKKKDFKLSKTYDFYKFVGCGIFNIPHLHLFDYFYWTNVEFFSLKFMKFGPNC